MPSSTRPSECGLLGLLGLRKQGILTSPWPLLFLDPTSCLQHSGLLLQIRKRGLREAKCFSLKVIVEKGVEEWSGLE